MLCARAAGSFRPCLDREFSFVRVHVGLQVHRGAKMHVDENLCRKLTSDAVCTKRVFVLPKMVAMCVHASDFTSCEVSRLI